MFIGVWAADAFAEGKWVSVSTRQAACLTSFSQASRGVPAMCIRTPTFAHTKTHKAAFCCLFVCGTGASGWQHLHRKLYCGINSCECVLSGLGRRQPGSLVAEPHSQPSRHKNKLSHS